ncbi:unnamed protein product [Linum trigynum]|uniref:Uncharacterized protein n=1 Tax=Linum trigynum TaxID=586398 RepID=A0AAV2EGG4_9ROSI
MNHWARGGGRGRSSSFRSVQTTRLPEVFWAELSAALQTRSRRRCDDARRVDWLLSFPASTRSGERGVARRVGVYMGRVVRV